MSIHPRDVLLMERVGTLSPVIKDGWTKASGQDPVDAARKSLRKRSLRFIRGVLLVGMAIAVAFIGWSLLPHPVESTTAELTLAFSVLGLVATGFFLIANMNNSV